VPVSSSERRLLTVAAYSAASRWETVRLMAGPRCGHQKRLDRFNLF
jgi:hypothetical protein